MMACHHREATWQMPRSGHHIRRPDRPHIPSASESQARLLAVAGLVMGRQLRWLERAPDKREASQPVPKGSEGPVDLSKAEKAPAGAVQVRRFSGVGSSGG